MLHEYLNVLDFYQRLQSAYLCIFLFLPFYWCKQSHKKRSSDTSFFVHFWTHFCQIGGVLTSHIHFLSPIIQNVLYILCAKVVLNDTYNPKYMNYEIKLFRIFIFRRSPKLKSSKFSLNQAQLLQKWF